MSPFSFIACSSAALNLHNTIADERDANDRWLCLNTLYMWMCSIVQKGPDWHRDCAGMARWNEKRTCIANHIITQNYDMCSMIAMATIKYVIHYIYEYVLFTMKCMTPLLYSKVLIWHYSTRKNPSICILHSNIAYISIIYIDVSYYFEYHQLASERANISIEHLSSQFSNELHCWWLCVCVYLSFTYLLLLYVDIYCSILDTIYNNHHYHNKTYNNEYWIHNENGIDVMRVRDR